MAEQVIDEGLIKARKRFYDDLDFYGRWALKIRTKEGTIAPFAMNSVQRRFHSEVEDQRRRTGRVRKIILKGRQQGLSTYVGARMYWRLSQRKARKGLVVAHKADSTNTLFQMYHRYHNACPSMLKPSTKFSSRKELVFNELDTGIMVATAGGEGIARSETLTDAHLSELAFWPSATAAENFNALDQTIPNTADTEVFIESTACGFNLFKELWDAAMTGQSDYEAFFAAWFETPEYREPAPEDFERTLEEEDLVARFGLDNEQLVWRRKKIAKTGRALFLQEYPSTPEEAFISSGRPVFNPDQLTALLKDVPEPLYRMAVEETGAQVMLLAKHSVGELSVYREHDPGETYVIGADVGKGVRDGDWSVAQVLDSEKRLVATYRAQVHSDYFARVLQALGLYYNTALVAPEAMDHGILTCVYLWKELGYPQVYIDTQEGQMEDRDTINVGFHTNVKTRPLIIDRLRASMREDDITVCDATTLREMLTFVVNEKGKMIAENGCHDDCVMSLAIANHVHPGRWKPIPVTDDFYVRAI
jgi:hypothetical protein